MKREGIRLRPTALWILFGPILACMWLAAVNYSNNLVYGILYLVGSLTFVTVFHTWRNLAALRVEHVRVLPACAGDEVRVELHLINTAGHPVYGLHFFRAGEETVFSRRPALLAVPDGRPVGVAAGDSLTAVTCFTAGRRGLYRFETLLVSSSYPFGLVRASFRVPVETEYFVYPQPKGNTAWPEFRSGGENGIPVSLKPGDDFSGVRAYMPGESLRHVDWKAYARGRPLSVKQFTGGEGRELWLDSVDLASLPMEERFSQMALWIINAEKAEIPYSLRLGRTNLSLGLGPEQSRRALEALAVAGMDLKGLT